MSEMIPRGWILTKIPKIADVNPKSFLDDFIDVGFVPMASVPVDFSHSVIFETYKWSEVKKGYTHFKNNDVIFAKITPCFENGKSAVICNMPNDYGAGSTEYYVLRTVASPSKYLFYLIKTQDFLDTGASLMTGSVGQKRVPKSYIQEYVIPFPPLNEQKRIVAKLDKIMPRIDAVKERLDKIPAIIKRFRQSVLTAAVTGKLTEKWRAEHPDVENLKSVLLPSLKIITHEEYRNLWNDFEIPENWICIHLKEIADLRLGKMLDDSKNIGKETKYLRNVNVRWFQFELDDLKTIKIQSEEIQKLSIKNGDVFICEGGEPGRAAVWQLGENDMTFQKALHRVRFNGNVVSDWLVYNLKADADSDRLSELFTGSTIKHFTGRSLAEYPFPLPPLPEQKEIVRQVDKFFALADRLESHYQKAKARVDKLSQSVLAKAFRGELVITEAELAEKEGRDFESAEKLLERILEEKAKLCGKGKTASDVPKAGVKKIGRKKK